MSHDQGFRIVSGGTGPNTNVLYDGKALVGVLGVMFSVRADGVASVLLEVDTACLDLELPQALLDVVTIADAAEVERLKTVAAALDEENAALSARGLDDGLALAFARAELAVLRGKAA